MSARVRVLDASDLQAMVQLLAVNPLHNIFVGSRVFSGGVSPITLGCEILGWEVNGRLVSALHNGANLIPVNATPQALDEFARWLGPVRRCASISGVSAQATGLWERLCRQWPAGSWASPREVRPHQPLMVLTTDPLVPGDERVAPVTRADADAYFEAAVAMYTEEVGVSPLDGTNGYRWYVERLIDSGRAFGIVEPDGSVSFKSDVGSAIPGACQVAGVWLRPDLRGQGLSAPAMSQVARLCRRQWDAVTLYVNDYNTRARALYRRCGFVELDEFATLLY